MIDYIKGKPEEVTPTYVVIDCGGIGYEVNITLLDYSEISATSEIKMFVHESIREDAHILYGFLSRRSRELFRLLIGVSGVGPNTARLILSALNSSQLENVISSGDESTLKSVKGIGGKTAQRIIVDLKDKIKTTNPTLITSVPASEVYDDALAALTMLGFASAQSQKVLRKLLSANSSITTEEAIKQALTML
ncbi:MAG: Holliday junction branch migration protein RuvA [Candidatus Amulumruptor caecigallinarius]|nr:Holliday junction branch migration protein RuvA [Candidatus Amulumruptor caecigallinarius]